MADCTTSRLTWTVLKPYTDRDLVSAWARVSTAFTIETGIFTPQGNKILPKQTVTNAEALAWVREARYPLYTFVSTNDFHGQLETKDVEQLQSELVGGSAYDMTYINTYRALNPLGTVLLDARRHHAGHAHLEPALGRVRH